MAYYANSLKERPMPTRNVVVTDHQSDLIDGLVAAGRYQNASEVLREGLRLVERQEAELRQIREGILEGLAQAERGEFAEGTGEEVIRRAFAKARERTGI